MNDILIKIQSLVAASDIRVSEHGYDALTEDDLTAREIVAGVSTAAMVEEYPNYGKGPAVLLLQRDRLNNPVHVVWGIPKGSERPAVIVTAYRPDPKRWDETLTRRRQS